MLTIKNNINLYKREARHVVQSFWYDKSVIVYIINDGIFVLILKSIVSKKKLIVVVMSIIVIKQ